MPVGKSIIIIARDLSYCNHVILSLFFPLAAPYDDYMVNRFIGSSNDVCELVRQESDTVILAFSSGKDSVGAWLQLRRYFAHVVPFYLYLCPDLDFVENSLRYYEEFFGTRIIRLPHPATYNELNHGVFASPASLAVIRRAGLPIFNYDDVHRILCEDLNLPLDTFYAFFQYSVRSLNYFILLGVWPRQFMD